MRLFSLALHQLECFTAVEELNLNPTSPSGDFVLLSSFGSDSGRTWPSSITILQELADM